MIVVEPCLTGTTLAAIRPALADRPHRFLSTGVPHEEPRRYDEAAEHDAAFGLTTAGIRECVGLFLASRSRL